MRTQTIGMLSRLHAARPVVNRPPSIPRKVHSRFASQQSAFEKFGQPCVKLVEDGFGVSHIGAQAFVRTAAQSPFSPAQIRE